MVKTTVKGQDRVDRLLKQFKQAANSYVSIGFHEEAGSYPQTGKGPPPMVVEVAFWNEFGTVTSPERSFMRSAIDEGEAQINNWRIELIDKVLEGKMTLDKALEALGFRIMTMIQNKIKSNVPPPNAPSTIAAKRSHGVSPKSGLAEGREGSGTLIDTGLMLRSVTYKVHIRD